MIIKIFFEFFLDAKSAAGKEKILKKAYSNLISMHSATAVGRIDETKFVVSVEVEEWERLVFKIISYAQTIGRQWILTGNIEHECSLWTNHSKLVGINSISVTADYISGIK